MHCVCLHVHVYSCLTNNTNCRCILGFAGIHQSSSPEGKAEGAHSQQSLTVGCISTSREANLTPNLVATFLCFLVSPDRQVTITELLPIRMDAKDPYLHPDFANLYCDIPQHTCAHALQNLQIGCFGFQDLLAFALRCPFICVCLDCSSAQG